MPKLGDMPSCPDPPSLRSWGETTREYEISLVTPLFGGGVEAGTPDETLPIRGTSIRGQFQFWWRATRGAACADRGDLFARHADVWGTTRNPSPVEIDIRDVTASAQKPCAKYSPGNDGKLQLDWEQPSRQLVRRTRPAPAYLGAMDRCPRDFRPGRVRLPSDCRRLRHLANGDGPNGHPARLHRNHEGQQPAGESRMEEVESFIRKSDHGGGFAAPDGR